MFTQYPTKDAMIFGRSDACAARLTKAITAHDGALVDRLAGFIHDSIDPYQNSLEVEKLRVRAILGDPYPRRNPRGQLDGAGGREPPADGPSGPSRSLRVP